MQTNIDRSIRYRIIAQQMNGTLVIQMVGQPQQILHDACQIMQNPELLSGFDYKDVALIGYIAGMESAEINVLDPTM